MVRASSQDIAEIVTPYLAEIRAALAGLPAGLVEDDAFVSFVAATAALADDMAMYDDQTGLAWACLATALKAQVLFELDQRKGTEETLPGGQMRGRTIDVTDGRPNR